MADFSRQPEESQIFKPQDAPITDFDLHLSDPGRRAVNYASSLGDAIAETGA